jgi:hypothetical protein
MADAGAQLAQFKAVIATTDVPLLGPQRRPGTAGEAELNRKLADYFAAAKTPSSIQPLLRSAALLWHDHLDASHTVSQSIETRDGSWLHGIMHRREPDYGNAKYWFRRVGQHDAFPKLSARVATLLQKNSGELGERLIKNGEWQPLAFVDECERAEQGKDEPLTSLLRQLQAAEFDVLVEHTFSH